MQQELTDKHFQAIELLATGAKIGCIAETIGISRETLWRWRQQPEFEAAHRERMKFRRDQMKECVAEIVRLSLVAIERELRKVEDPKYHSNPIDHALAVMRMLEPSRIMDEPEEAKSEHLSPRERSDFQAGP